MRRLVLISLFGLFVIEGAAILPSIAATDPADEQARRERLVEGARRYSAFNDYQAHCVSCHGEEGKGVGGVVDLTSPRAVAEMTRDGMIGIALDGHDPRVASAWAASLDKDRLAAVVDFMRDAFMLPAPDADASLGRKIFAETCSVCHGERGDAASWAKNALNPAPFDFTSAKAKTLSRQHMINTVTYGSPDTAMMSFSTQLSRHEIAAVIDYIRQTFTGIEPVAVAAAATAPSDHDQHAAHGHVVGGDIDAPFPHDLIGDYDKGKAFYEKNCADCHGAEGKGDGRRAYFMRRKPQNFTAPEARDELNRPHLFSSISKGVKQTEMPAWSTVLSDQQIANVAEYVFVDFIRDGEAPTPNWRADGHDHGQGSENHDAATDGGAEAGHGDLGGDRAHEQDGAKKNH